LIVFSIEYSMEFGMGFWYWACYAWKWYVLRW